MSLLTTIWQFIKSWRTDLRARAAKYLVTREVVKVLQLTHAQELATTPRNDWSIVRQRQVEEIKAVQSGQQFDIVDRRSWAFPYLPEALHRLNQPILKNTPYNLRRFSETPIPRRAMNIVKNAVLSFKWQIKPTKDFVDDVDPDREQRIRIATETLKRPNEAGESFRDLFEQGLEDFLINGAACFEHRITPFFKRPTKFWAVDSSTIRLFLDWTESTPDRPRYAQMTGLKGERGIVTFLNNELYYIRDNIRTSTPFGLGRLEVAFQSVNAFLGVQDMSTRAGSDQVHKTWLWWETALNPSHINLIRRHITNELEGQAKVSLVAGAKKPEVVEVTPVTPEDLLLEWQKFLIQIIAAAFDLSPQALNMDDHPNRSTAQVMATADWRTAVVPVATRFQEAWTRLWLHDTLGWKDLEFEFDNIDDPDPVALLVLMQRMYAMNSIVPNEIRKRMGMGPLPGPFGKLTQGQTQLIIMEAQAMLGAQPKASGSMPGGSSGSSGMSSPGSLGTGMQASVHANSLFAANDVANMDPQTVQLYQELGLLPPSDQLMDQMDSQSPGILDQLSDELTQYFQNEITLKRSEEVEPAPVTRGEESQQIQKYQEDQHQESLAEFVINRRGVFGPAVNSQVRKSSLRGKYPRSSSGGFVDQQALSDRAARKDNPLKTGKPKKNYRRGQGNNAI
jgi:hypothetical protein